ncbi:MAG: dTMP kinase [Pelagibacteraceae bacterium]|nr:dTMP kinase [Pelagibacteraceae bacterium]|tara:strand:+ start:12302 stop:12949 length:648 start_codon:yes stop_codon:yes gene_type:complete
MFKKKPFFIVFEGVEGCGKSYQSKKLKKYLEKKGISPVLTREPGGTRSAESIRKLILQDYFKKGNKEKFDKYTDTLLYLAARNEHVKNKIIPALKRKKIVICDRFTDSTLAYQVYGKKVDKLFIDTIHKKILRNLKPDLTFILKVTPKISKLRLSKRKTKNRYDNFSQKFYTKVQNYFLRLAKNKKNYFILESSANDINLEVKILKLTLKRLGIK